MLTPMPTSPIFSAIVPAPLGAIGVRTTGGLLQELVYLPPSYALQDPADALAEQAAAQLERYFAEPDFRFDLPLATVGTGFQQRVWSAIASIPRGTQTCARRIGSSPIPTYRCMTIPTPSAMCVPGSRSRQAG